jgi:hypothetical protein
MAPSGGDYQFAVDSDSGCSGSGGERPVFVVLTTPSRPRAELDSTRLDLRVQLLNVQAKQPAEASAVSPG